MIHYYICSHMHNQVIRLGVIYYINGIGFVRLLSFERKGTVCVNFQGKKVKDIERHELKAVA